jgi:hypothetical protein
MGTGTPAASRPCSIRRGKPSALVQDLRAAMPDAASGAHRPSMTEAERAESATAAALKTEREREKR